MLFGLNMFDVQVVMSVAMGAEPHPSWPTL